MFWTYYLDGQLKSHTDRDGQSSSYNDDANNNLIKAANNGTSDPAESQLDKADGRQSGRSRMSPGHP